MNRQIRHVTFTNTEARASEIAWQRINTSPLRYRAASTFKREEKDGFVTFTVLAYDDYGPTMSVVKADPKSDQITVDDTRLHSRTARAE